MNPISCYESIDVAHNVRLQGTYNQQTNVNIHYLNPTGRGGSQSGSTAGLQVREQGISIGYFSLHNRTGGASAAGIGVRIPNTLWVAGSWVELAGTPFTDDTADAQYTTGAGDFALETLVVQEA